jgi:hypothetical protein
MKVFIAQRVSNAITFILWSWWLSVGVLLCFGVFWCIGVVRLEAVTFLSFGVLIIRTPCTCTVTQLLRNPVALPTKLNFTADNSFFNPHCLSVPIIQGAAVNVTHFESRITLLLYTAINTTEHGQVSQCLDSQKASCLQYNVLEMSSMTIKALLPSPRYTCHDATYSVLRNIRSLLTNCIYETVNVREGVSKNLSFQIPP